MCQMSVLLEKDGELELLMKNVSELEVKGDAVVLSMLFEKPLEIRGAMVRRIDFSDGKVFLAMRNKGGG